MIPSSVNLFLYTDAQYYIGSWLIVRPRWKRLAHMPRLYRAYRRAGVARWPNLQLCWRTLTVKIYQEDPVRWYDDPNLPA